MKAPLILTAMLLSATAATAQTVTIYEPVTLPFEYTESGMIKAQHIKPGDVTPEEYQRLLEEADKVRAFQGSTGISNAYVTPEPAMGVSAITTVVADAGEPTQAFREHVVVKGDTLYNISKRYSVGVTQIQDANDLSSSGISLGQALRIPSAWTTAVSSPVVTEPVTSSYNTQHGVVLANTQPTVGYQTVPAAVKAKPYAVVPGDTLYSISKRACVGVDALKAVNGMGGNAISPGQKLTLPGGHCLR